MEQKNENIESLLTDYLSGELTDAGRRQLTEFLKDEKGRRLFRRHVQGWWLVRAAVRWQELDARAAWEEVKRRATLRRRTVWRRVAGIAALVAVAAGIGWYAQDRQEEANPEFFAAVMPTGATLTLSNGEEIVLKPQVAGIVKRDTTGSIELTAERGLAYTAAPTVQDDTVLRHNTLRVPQGCNFLLTLSDGSRVWLNAESTLRYPEKFAAGKREVELEGEGFFEVQADSTAPFYINAHGLKTVVLGTTFNLKAYPDDPEVVTTLVTGRIRQECEGIRSISLMPNTQSVYNPQEEHLQTSPVNPAEALAWKNGRFIFKNRPLEEIFRELIRWYRLEEVTYFPPELRHTCFYLNTERFEDVRTVLEKLEKTKTLGFELKGNKVCVYEKQVKSK